MGMDPTNRKATMKNVAGFHSFDFGFFADLHCSGCSERRSGLGMRDFQKDSWKTLGGELACRTNWLRVTYRGVVRRIALATTGSRRALYRIALFISWLWDLGLVSWISAEFDCTSDCARLDEAWRQKSATLKLESTRLLV